MRLQWKRRAEGGFIAYPNGDEHPDQYVTLVYIPTPANIPPGGPEWFWRAKWGDRFSVNGRAYAKQPGADAAAAGWFEAVAEAEKREKTDRPVRAFITKLVETGEYDLADLDIERMSYPDLIRMMDECTRRWQGGAVYPKCEFGEAIEAVIALLSAEFHRRRI